MDSKQIVSDMNGFLHTTTNELATWLNKMLPLVTDEWWEECVLSNLTFEQRSHVQDNAITEVQQLDLAALLRITDKSWQEMRSVAYLPTSERDRVRTMRKVRNNWAHVSGNIPEKDIVIADARTIHDFLEAPLGITSHSLEINDFIQNIENTDFAVLTANDFDESDLAREISEAGTPGTREIEEKDRVYLKGNPAKKGMVFSISEINGTRKYEVFVDGELSTFYEDQIVLIEEDSSQLLVDIDTLQSNLTAYEINNPSFNNLYSLNAARIDFVPYQFRPALKLIKSDEPRILIADSVGVGKTIEAGLIIKELEARNELDSILVICPKPLVAERKWELEMRRFDEDFIPVDGITLRQILSDTDRDGSWPTRYNKAIIPYSVLDSRVYQGSEKQKGKSYGLLDLDPAPHFDLVIIDEAHHIRNGSLEKEKAFAYKCVRYFCEHASAVVMLTATPLQTSNDDLYTLLNLLRPDVIIDKEVFSMMTKPNEYIYRAAHMVRGAGAQWQENTRTELQKITSTHWGETVIAQDPVYKDVLNRLKGPVSSREQRVQLISDIESLHSFNTMLNRTRRKDIQDFCVRRAYTVETLFTPEQSELHDKLMMFEFETLSRLHNVRSIAFLMSTIRRQAASCIFGLAPYIQDIIARRFNQMNDDPDMDTDEFSLDVQATDTITMLARDLLQMAENLPDEDPKFDSIAEIIKEKQNYDNNKIILFSTFRHTITYIMNRLSSLGYRVAQINGSVKDNDRLDIHERFELPKETPEAIDILLLTEVGSEGLDYQFCNTMINYDLPWNPMRIEQRIGRIDRRGQKSDVVNIYNVITQGTVDADIYERCLMRIGIFEKSVGECEEVLGEIGSQIEQIAMDPYLTSQERQEKLEQMADNEIRTMQELSRLEDEEQSLFGFDLSNYTTTKEIKNAESPWMSPQNIQRLVERYLAERLGSNRTFIIGSSELKQLRLDRDSRSILLEDSRNLTNIKSDLKQQWEQYLKGPETLHPITFTAETASKESKAFFITPTHPLVKQAAKYFAVNKPVYVQIKYYTDDLPTGIYPFSLYTWSYMGIRPRFKIVPVCINNTIEAELSDILQEADSATVDASVSSSDWDQLESRQIDLLMSEKEKYKQSVLTTAKYRLESIGASYRNRKRTLEQKIQESFDERIRRMYQAELDTATETYRRKVDDINMKTDSVDIHTALIANGLLEIQGDK